MATARGTELSLSIRKKLEELKKACAELDDATASLAPEGRFAKPGVSACGDHAAHRVASNAC